MSDKYFQLQEYFKYQTRECKLAMIITLELVGENVLANDLKLEYNKFSEKMKGDHE